MFTALATAAVLASTAYAQSLNISSGCQSALAGVAASPEAECLNAAGLVASFATVNGDTSLISPLDKWLTGLCSQDACTNSTLSSIITNVTNGCSSDLSSLGFSSDDTSTVISAVQAYYPTARSLVCLQNSTSHNLCITDALTTAQSGVGTLSENNLMSIVSNVIGGNVNASVIPQSLICSDCTKAAVTILNKNVSGLLPDDAQSYLTSTCGSSFTDGTTPSTVAETAKGEALASSNSNGAMSSFPVKSLVGSLSVLASAFVVLA
ncbi:hypothetical protein PENSPDRAFT_607939 [Peniophora sp. CONT]|nr:hypothetical protein PENSPDRAFT_607939 [Peniophora sp. CONT]